MNHKSFLKIVERIREFLKIIVRIKEFDEQDDYIRMAESTAIE